MDSPLPPAARQPIQTIRACPQCGALTARGICGECKGAVHTVPADHVPPLPPTPLQPIPLVPDARDGLLRQFDAHAAGVGALEIQAFAVPGAAAALRVWAVRTGRELVKRQLTTPDMVSLTVRIGRHHSITVWCEASS